ncbi:MAG: hypothetical protein E6J34_08140 [Chloroflexi bacterium]|nr:MAG: hypothetical protein E6J34_08140 [Chloroflexota bacterium]
MCQSEVALLRQKIELEMESMQRGLSGLNLGTARHAFIHTRMDHIGGYQDTLAHHIGVDEAQQVVCQLYVQTMEAGSSEPA